MTAVGLILRAGARDLSRNRWLIAYAALVALVGGLLLFLGGTGNQVVLSLLNATLLVVPLVALVFGTVQVHASREFIELLLAQPLARRSVFLGLYLGLALPFAAAYVVGIAIPFAVAGRGTGAPLGALLLLVASGAILSLIFTGIAMAIALAVDDRLRGTALALVAWFVLTLGYDAAVLGLVATLGDWPLERPLLAMMVLNPADLARVTVLTSLDAAALLGYTGAVYRRTFGSGVGVMYAIAAAALWTVVPALLARRTFLRRDF